MLANKPANWKSHYLAPLLPLVFHHLRMTTLKKTLDLNEYMVQRPTSTFMLRVEGESMRDAGIMPNDILVVDRSIKPVHIKILSQPWMANSQ